MNSPQNHATWLKFGTLLLGRPFHSYLVSVSYFSRSGDSNIANFKLDLSSSTSIAFIGRFHFIFFWRDQRYFLYSPKISMYVSNNFLLPTPLSEVDVTIFFPKLKIPYKVFPLPSCCIRNLAPQLSPFLSCFHSLAFFCIICLYICSQLSFSWC